MKKKRTTKLTATVWKEGKHYIAQCINIDVSSFGKTKKEAMDKLEEAIELYFENKPGKVPEIKSPSIEVRELQHV